jgi:hypothetical protein
LDSTYTGALIRVRRSSDNTELDINSNVFGELDTVSLLAFAGTGDAFCKVWYDQSGNSNDATQTATGSQPKIVSSGAVVVENGKPAVDYSNGDILQTSAITLVAQPTSRITVATTASPLYASGEGFQDGTSVNRQQVGYNSSGEWRIYSGTVATASSSPVAGNTYLMFALFNGANSSLHVDSNFIYTANVGSDGFDGVSLGGGIGNSQYGRVTGKIQEAIIYDSDQDAAGNRAGIETNINTFYNIY